MAIHVRRKRNVTPRFKPDMWGRDPGGEGEVLYDGTVTLEDLGQGIGAVIELLGTYEAGKQLTLTANGVEYLAIGGEEGTVFLDGGGESAWMFGKIGDDYVIASATGTAGDTASIKLVQGEIEYETIFSDNVTLVSDQHGDNMAVIEFTTPAVGKYLRLMVNGEDLGKVVTTGDLPYQFTSVKSVSIGFHDTDVWNVNTPDADSDGLGAGTFMFNLGVSKATLE